MVYCYTDTAMRDKIEDVVSVNYVNQSQPTHLTFQAEQQPAPTADYENENLVSLARELDRIDSEQTKKRKESRPYCKYIQRNGYASRFERVCGAYDIKTVGQLLSCGRSNFERLRNMGKYCADIVAQALTNLYGIEKW